MSVLSKGSCPSENLPNYQTAGTTFTETNSQSESVPNSSNQICAYLVHARVLSLSHSVTMCVSVSCSCRLLRASGQFAIRFLAISSNQNRNQGFYVRALSLSPSSHSDCSMVKLRGMTPIEEDRWTCCRSHPPDHVLTRKFSRSMAHGERGHRTAGVRCGNLAGFLRDGMLSGGFRWRHVALGKESFY